MRRRRDPRRLINRRTFLSSPSLKHYRKLRHKNPRTTFRTTPNLFFDERAYIGTELEERFGIDYDIWAHAESGDPNAVSKLSLLLIDKVLERNKLEESGETHLVGRGKAISDSLINAVIFYMIEAVLLRNVFPNYPADLMALMHHQIVGFENRFRANVHARNTRSQILKASAIILHLEGSVSVRRVAKFLNLAPSTVSRCFPKDGLQEAAREEMNSSWFKNQINLQRD